MKKVIMLASLVALCGCSADKPQEVEINSAANSAINSAANSDINSDMNKASNKSTSKESEANPATLNAVDTVSLTEPLTANIETEKQKKINALSTAQTSAAGEPSQYSVAINNEKFITDNVVIKTGQSLFNMQMNDYGVVKGSFVIISTVTPQWLESDFSIDNIAKETYRLAPHSADEDLYAWYKQLAKDVRFSVVELEVDYSGKAHVPEF
ncbi:MULTISPECIES: hypothetical protein [unclassified Shewanella]|uniref:hypothetical protein n=1 Tax=unclassified Shewanella TaxID=196818 RepID=UPI000C822F6D|nr:MULTISPECIES: hypothetical protein [unclassified Shewanella]MDO6679593.1 hypothetical protein [Shewanella sp. 4_MG-2023]MDO6776554.1 hypothetical protein [Shewanella sp. 3_MG-2023]PMG52170.1 hypothetical protein BCU91_15610 [Shewanella sp. 10N.286.52.B9]PMH87476.1 hypothetical protein BCU57_06960 [Shewanella sp. 10N.286.48.B5]